MPPIFYLATPVPLAMMIIAVIVFWLKRNAYGLKWLLTCWVALNAFGYWWFNYDAARANAEGHLVVDAGFVNSFNCAVLGSIGLAIGLVACLTPRSKITPKGQQ